MDANLWLALFFIVFNPIFWILVARREHQHFTLSYWIGSRRLAFVIFAWTIILLATVRNWRFLVCLRSQPKWSVLQENWILWLGHVLVVSGLILLIASFVSLGFAGAFLGKI
ncbi:hypothetical protein CAPTEDRAFT_134110 [Capitella teleta]|uniref:Uncharacterized protein n=1 Tax=Capitella teleta TaxID=283909 RepID=R7V7Y2_CAPTE|nr:hypothetical protein CAPTEDRAFT_134110 [Capitella teleta]|eukprot:ELU14602.1 hypothetical protein CAPTEDRAFT_134110 [Capitella teleta]